MSAAHLQLMDEREAMDARANWDDLPLELWPKIRKSLCHHVDLLQFRSVCNSWRSSRERVRRERREESEEKILGERERRRKENVQ